MWRNFILLVLEENLSFDGKPYIFDRNCSFWVGSVWRCIITEAKSTSTAICQIAKYVHPDSLAQIICLSKIVQDNYKLEKVFGCLWQFSKLGFISEVWTRQSKGSPIIRIWALCGAYLSPKMGQFYDFGNIYFDSQMWKLGASVMVYICMGLSLEENGIIWRKFPNTFFWEGVC